MKTKIEFSIQDYKMVHYDRPIMSLYAGIFFFIVTVFALVLGLIRGEHNDPEGFKGLAKNSYPHPTNGWNADNLLV